MVLATAYGLSVFVNNEFILFIGILVFFVWSNRVAAKFNDKIVKVTTLTLIIVVAVWVVGLLMWGSSF
jgi:hypothetical protein